MPEIGTLKFILEEFFPQILNFENLIFLRCRHIIWCKFKVYSAMILYKDKPKIQSLGQEDPLEKEVVTHSNILAWETHGQRSLVGYGLWGRKRVRYDLVTEQQQQA